ncbi:hypothetical protein KHC33_03490 [Methanospirillum sp. J.3.6.1-F.2.7.3]|jgi:hypothetical protein|uniref:Uncharacterized protein n=2 Tax=Methanospirillum TaxID=2202 RepID=A0A8E7B0B3_9EURY|nr:MULTISPECIES: hypothetical protein [Methanospirillum]MDX8549767.1 hypothetical protein [Methanospirillum hungatei]QVV89599.1 hypothetical protein KHC33_03490 [Methanospirillum sp. J.3.6.1-F.2.7.3]QXO96111.1 hypothetical protein KSK55_07025 [Methanospirillum hungatei]
MVLETLKRTLHLLIHRPLLWISGVYAGCIAALVIWLEFTGGMFLAGKIAMLAVIAFPFIVGIMNHHLMTGDTDLKNLITTGLRNYFPIVLPVVILGGMIVIMALLLSVPLSIMGYGSDEYALTGLMLGILIPAILFSIYIDNVAVCEKTRIFDTLKRSLELVTIKLSTSVGFFIISVIMTVIVSLFGAFLWGMILADRFTQFIDMNLTTQQGVFSQYTLTDWQALIGPEGTIVTSLVFGLVTFILVPFLLTFKYSCYKEATQEVVTIPGEYDEKGRWYKY